MIAITLSFDEHAPFVQLMVEKYAELWPDHPFVFRMPYNDEPDGTLTQREDVELVQTPIDIRETMRALLNGLNEHQWVYWAIDDRYPVALRKPEVLRGVTRMVQEELVFSSVDEIKIINHDVHGDLCGKMRMATGGVRFYEQQRKRAYGFWMHHFIRAGLLWQHFDEDLRDTYSIKEVTAKLKKRRGDEVILMPESSIIQFAEPCRRGYITENALADLQALGIKPPVGMDIRRTIVFGVHGEGG